MAPRTSGGASHFTDKREQKRTLLDNSAPAMCHPLSPPLERDPAYDSGQNDLKFPPEPGIAGRRQLSRQEKGDGLRIVGPPLICNPNELPNKKRSIYSLIEKAQNVFENDNGEDIASLAAQVAFAHLEPQHRTTFDDTTSVSTDADYIDHEMNHNDRLVALSTDYNKGNHASNPKLELVESRQANKMRGEDNGEGNDEEFIQNLQPPQYISGAESLPNWREEVEAEKEFQRTLAASNQQGRDHDLWNRPTRLENQHCYEDSSVDFYEHEDGGYNENDQPLHHDGHSETDFIEQGSHSPIQKPLSTNQADLHLQSTSEEKHAIAQSKAQTRTEVLAADAGHAKGAISPIPVLSHVKVVHHDKTVHIPRPAIRPQTTTVKAGAGLGKQGAQLAIPMRPASPPKALDEPKATSFGSSSPSPNSEDELALPYLVPSAVNKRNFEESIDYPREQLTEMTYSDLESKPFLTDPKESARDTPHYHDQHDVKLHLEPKLSKMTEMTEEQCKAMFEAMTDAENEKTSKWFTEMVKKDMEKLMRAKHRRRMVALKFEYEVKRRNALVNAKKTDVEEELADLKNGLGNLMPASISTSAAERKNRSEQMKKAAKTRK